MILNYYNEKVKLFFFSLFICLITYGFGLFNFTLSIDGESPIYPDFVMPLGRWGLNLIRYHIFKGYTPYFTLLSGLIFMSMAATELSKIFNLKEISSYIFCALFLSFPQLAYQLIFIVQADAVSLGFLLSVLSFKLFLNAVNNSKKKYSILQITVTSLLLTFSLSIYQALIFIPVIVYLIYILLKTYEVDFLLKNEIKTALVFGLMLVFSVGLYALSVYVICPPLEESYLSSYVAAEQTNRFSAFYDIWYNLVIGKSFYGNKLFLLTALLIIATLIKFAILRKLFFIRFTLLLLLIIVPFLISFFITGTYHPPRLYVTMGIIFAIIFTHFIKDYKFIVVPVFVSGLVCLMNIYFITELYYSNYRIGNLDENLAKKIDLVIQMKYPQFDPKTDYVYFHGRTTTEAQDKFTLPQSEVFGGSFFNWDSGNNYRIICFFKYNGIADYKMIEKEPFLKIKDSIASMPVWPNSESVKLLNGVMIVKLGSEFGSPLPFDMGELNK